VREIHNVNVITVGDGTETSLHLKLPGGLSLQEAHDVAEQVEEAIRDAVPEIGSVRTHIEPLTPTSEGQRPAAGDVEAEAESVLRIVEEATGRPPRDLRFIETDSGLVAFLTLALGPDTDLARAHAVASEIEERIRAERPEIADMHVHTEP